MTVWCSFSTILRYSRFWRRAMVIFTIFMTIVAFSTTLFFVTRDSFAAPGTTKTVSFQGRLRAASGAVVPDGHYNIQFKLYESGSGEAAGNPDGTLKWTETYVNAGSESGVEVRNGFFNVSLGSLVPFGTSVDWNQDTILLSMNVAGTSATCTNFGGAGCTADGEMLPMKQISASPFAINSGMLSGKTADNFIQLAQGVQVDASTNSSSIFINKTGTGNLVQLQSNGADIFTINGAGSIAFGNATNQSISITKSADDTTGRELAITAGEGGNGAGANGGNLVLQGGNAGGTNANGGNISIDAGAGTGTGTGGTIAIGTANASDISIGGGNANVTIGSSGSATAGSTAIQGKDSVSISTNGETRITISGTENKTHFGNGALSATPNDYTIQGTDSSAAGVAGGDLSVQGGNATTGDTDGGNLILSGGNGSGTGNDGSVVIGKADDNKTTLLQLDSGNAAPGATLEGSMYYDTTLGRMQCYEATGWGSCGASPDNFITLTPEFANTVSNGSNLGSLTSDFCSDALAINNGSSAQPTICGTDETYNFYKWTTSSNVEQTRSLFVTHKLPDNFKAFIEGSTSLLARTDNVNSTVDFQIYKNTGTGLVACGALQEVSTGNQTTWQKKSSQTTDDPFSCDFSAGDSIVFKINLKAKDNANAYVSNLSFAITNR